MDEDIAFGLVMGFLVGMLFMAIFALFIVTDMVNERNNLADGLCKLKYGEDYRFVEFEEDNLGNQEVICEKHKKPDFDSVVIRGR